MVFGAWGTPMGAPKNKILEIETVSKNRLNVIKNSYFLSPGVPKWVLLSQNTDNCISITKNRLKIHKIWHKFGSHLLWKFGEDTIIQIWSIMYENTQKTQGAFHNLYSHIVLIVHIFYESLVKLSLTKHKSHSLLWYFFRHRALLSKHRVSKIKNPTTLG